jgi:uncharacterized protein
VTPHPRQTIGELELALHLQTNSNQKLFTGHGTDYVAINGQRFHQPMVVTADGVRSDWGPSDFDNLTAAHFDYFLQMKPEVLLLGTGAKQRFAHPELFHSLILAGISIEFMDTPAACRTYNILVAEDRKVVAAVML